MGKFWDHYISDTLSTKLDVMEYLKETRSPAFTRICEAYAEDYGENAARYMASTLGAWGRGVEMNSSSRYRIKTLAFPVIPDSEQNRIVRALYEDYRERNPERQNRLIVIGHEEDKAINELRMLVEKYRSNPYEMDMRWWPCYKGIMWVCRESSSTATTLLQPIVKEEGESMYGNAHWRVEAFITQFRRGQCVPGKYEIPLSHTSIVIKVRYPILDKTRRRIRQAAANLRSRWRSLLPRRQSQVDLASSSFPAKASLCLA
jgi:hypothetical protein